MRDERDSRTCAVHVKLTLVNAIAQVGSGLAILWVRVVQVFVAHDYEIVSIIRRVIGTVISRASYGVSRYRSHCRGA